MSHQDLDRSSRHHRAVRNAGVSRSSRPPTAAKAGEGAEAREKLDLIGQFGIGFYSAFMVADRVDVFTRRAGANEALHWSSDGKGTFSIEPLAQEDAPVRGTRVVLHLKTNSKDYLEPGRIEQIVRDHSSALTVPIELVEEKGRRARRISDGSALWTKPKAAITEHDYNEFYQTLGGDV